MRERIMNVLKKKEDNKGFTLVELIVVIVILAILAAILVPGLLKWIDKAKEEQYVLEARNVYLAAEAQIAEMYAADASTKPTAAGITAGTTFTKLADVETPKVESITFVGDTDTDMFEVKTITVSFKAADTKAIKATLSDGTWKIDSIG